MYLSNAPPTTHLTPVNEHLDCNPHPDSAAPSKNALSNVLRLQNSPHSSRAVSPLLRHTSAAPCQTRGPRAHPPRAHGPEQQSHRQRVTTTPGAVHATEEAPSPGGERGNAEAFWRGASALRLQTRVESSWFHSVRYNGPCGFPGGHLSGAEPAPRLVRGKLLRVGVGFCQMLFLHL